MTVPSLISQLLKRLEEQFYSKLPRRDFKRDQAYLVAALGTYGWECAQRGVGLRGGVHLRGAVPAVEQFQEEDVGQGNRVDAELFAECDPATYPGARGGLQARAQGSKGQGRVIKKVVDGARLAEVVICRSATEMAASVYKDVRKLRTARVAEAMAKKREVKRQGELL